MKLFDHLEPMAQRPAPFECYSSPDLWNDPHISKGMLNAHLDPSHDAASFRPSKIDASVAWIAERFAVGGATRICDLGCGPGLWTTRFADLGASATGVDFSDRSLEYARRTAAERGLDIRYIRADYTGRDLVDRIDSSDGFDLITLINADFSILSPAQRSVVLDSVRSLLVPGGSMLFDVCSASFFENAPRGAAYEHRKNGGFFCTDPHHLFTFHFRYDEELLLCDKHVVVSADREVAIYVWNQCYRQEWITGIVEAAGLTVADIYADVQGRAVSQDCRFFAVAAVARA